MPRRAPAPARHLIAEQFRLRTGIEYRHVPYRGSAPAVQDLLGGRVRLMFDNLPSALPQIQSGNLRAIAVTTAERSSLLPELPTIAESGYPGFDAPAWFAVLTSKAVPAPIRAELEKAIVEALKAPDTREKMKAAGVEVAADGSGRTGPPDRQRDAHMARCRDQGRHRDSVILHPACPDWSTDRTIGSI